MNNDHRPDAPLLLVGSANPHKVEEIRAILDDLPVEVAGADILPDIPEVEETGATFEENASLKALGFAQAAAPLTEREGFARRTIWVLSDDSGLCVDALAGRPGIHSARYAASSPGEQGNYAANNRKLLEELNGVPSTERGAHFVCVCALAEVPGPPGGEPRLLFTVRGECHGIVIEELRGSGGFGYDPLFLMPALGKTFAELPARQKNTISHRARALEALRTRLGTMLEE